MNGFGYILIRHDFGTAVFDALSLLCIEFRILKRSQWK